MIRIEQQAGASKAGTRHGKTKDRGSVIRTAAEGAYKKAVVSLTSDLMQFTPDEDKKWADELIPKSARPDAAIQAGKERDSTQTIPYTEDRQQYATPLKGVRWSKLTGPGPSGRRPEHYQDILRVKRKREVNLFLLSLGRLHAAMADGNLPDEARWLTRTRLCWQRKKNNKPRPIQMAEVVRSSFGKRVVKKHVVSI